MRGGLLIKFKAENTLNHISLHVCIVEGFLTDGQDLLVTFEHIDGLADHPLNNTGKAMYSGKAVLTFIDSEIVESNLYDTSEIKDKSRIVVETDAQEKELHYSDLLVDFEVLKNEEIYR